MRRILRKGLSRRTLAFLQRRTSKVTAVGVPSEHSFIESQDLYFIHCIWVHGHEQGRGNFQKRGMGRALLAAAESDARALGARRSAS